jgi:hypothetical protein
MLFTPQHFACPPCWYASDSELKSTVYYKFLLLAKKFSKTNPRNYLQGGSNMTGTNCDLFTHKSSRSYLNHLVYWVLYSSWGRQNRLLDVNKLLVNMAWEKGTVMKRRYNQTNASNYNYVITHACDLRPLEQWDSGSKCRSRLKGTSVSSLFLTN